RLGTGELASTRGAGTAAARQDFQGGEDATSNLNRPCGLLGPCARERACTVLRGPGAVMHRAYPAESAGEGGSAGGRSRRRGRAGDSRRGYLALARGGGGWGFAGGGVSWGGGGVGVGGLGGGVAGVGGLACGVWVEHVGERVDWRVVVGVVVHGRRRYQRRCSCDGPKTVMAPGPAKAIGKGLFSNGFIALLLTERYVAGRSQNSLVAGL